MLLPSEDCRILCVNSINTQTMPFGPQCVSPKNIWEAATKISVFLCSYSQSMAKRKTALNLQCSYQSIALNLQYMHDFTILSHRQTFKKVLFGTIDWIFINDCRKYWPTAKGIGGHKHFDILPFPKAMMTSSNGNIFRVNGPLSGESTSHEWFPLTRASDAELWCFLWSAPKQEAEQTTETPVIWDAIAPIMTSL